MYICNKILYRLLNNRIIVQVLLYIVHMAKSSYLYDNYRTPGIADQLGEYGAKRAGVYRRSGGNGSYNRFRYVYQDKKSSNFWVVYRKVRIGRRPYTQVPLYYYYYSYSHTQWR